MKKLNNSTINSRMSSTHNESNIREKGIQTLRTVMKNEKNIKTFEKYIQKIAEKITHQENYEIIYNRIIYQTVGDIINGTNIKVLLENIKNGLVDWKHPIFDNISKILKEHDEFIITPFEVEEGVTECKCGSKRVFTYTKQIRSADEPATTIAKCAKCHTQWTYSG
jgi:DNA-directed RNA polymerase subunit M/transcription elongation factor TFIIS